MAKPPSSVARAPQLPHCSFCSCNMRLSWGPSAATSVVSRNQWRGSMLYDAYEVQRSLLTGASRLAGLGAGWLNNPANPLAYIVHGPAGVGQPRGVRPRFGAARQARIRHRLRSRSAASRSRSARRSRSPSRSATSSISSRPASRPGPPLLIVAPMSGHYATLLRGTVERLLPKQDVYITDWADAKLVPLSAGRFRPRRLYRLSDRLPRP